MDFIVPLRGDRRWTLESLILCLPLWRESVISQVLTDVLSALDSRDRGLPFSVLNLIPLLGGRRNLPAIENPDSRLSWLDLARLGQLPDQSDRRAHACSLAGSELIAKSRRVADRH